MTFAFAGTDITQTGTDATPAGMTTGGGATNPAGSLLYSAGTNRLVVNGNLTVPRETLSMRNILVGATGNLTMGADDGNPLVRTISYTANPTIQFGQDGSLDVFNGATVTFRNHCFFMRETNTGNTFGSFSSLSWTFNALNSAIIAEAGQTKGWHYIGGGGVIDGLLIRNFNAAFFNSSPISVRNLTLVDTVWGVGLDSTVGANLEIAKSVIPRAIVQRPSNNVTLLDCKTTDWVSCRFQASASSSYRFSRTMRVAALGTSRAGVTVAFFDSANAPAISGLTDANGLIGAQAYQWGRILTSAIGENVNPDILAGKATPSQIMNNTGSIHEAGAYKLPLRVVCRSTMAQEFSSGGITFDITVDAILSDYLLEPIMLPDSYATTSRAALTGITFTAGTKTIAVSASMTLDDLYDFAKLYLVQNMGVTNFLVPVGTQLGLADWSITVGAGFVLSAGTKLTSLATTGTITGPGSITPLFTDANNAGSLAVTGAAGGDTIEMRRASNASILATRTGSGSFSVAPANVGVSVYFDRRVGANLVMSTITTPVTLIAGINPEVALFSGAQVQVAQAPRIDLLPTLAEVEASTILAKEATVAARPTLAQVEASTVIAKETTVLTRESEASAAARAVTDQAEHDATQAALGGIPASVWSETLEAGFTASRVVRTTAAAAAGKASGGPGSPVFRNLSDTADQITGTADANGNRTDATYGA